MKRRNVVYALGLSMGFAGNAEEAQQDEYLSQIQGSYVELFPELSRDENRATWEKYAAEYVDADAVADSVDYLLWMCTGDKYGQEAIDAFTEDPDSMQFDGYFLGDVAEFTVDGNTISGIDAGGNEVFSHAYKAMDMKNEDFLFYESEDADSGMFTYFAFSPDTPESTYHLEFRYADNTDDLQSWFEGNYDETMMDNCLKLFCSENLGGEGESESEAVSETDTDAAAEAVTEAVTE